MKSRLLNCWLCHYAFGFAKSRVKTAAFQWLTRCSCRAAKVQLVKIRHHAKQMYFQPASIYIYICLYIYIRYISMYVCMQYNGMQSNAMQRNVMYLSSFMVKVACPRFAQFQSVDLPSMARGSCPLRHPRLVVARVEREKIARQLLPGCAFKIPSRVRLFWIARKTRLVVRWRAVYSVRNRKFQVQMAWRNDSSCDSCDRLRC